MSQFSVYSSMEHVRYRIKLSLPKIFLTTFLLELDNSEVVHQTGGCNPVDILIVFQPIKI